MRAKFNVARINITHTIVQMMANFKKEDVHAGPAATVRPVRPWPYRFLREKNGVAWILAWLTL